MSKNRFCDASKLKAELDGYVLGQDDGVKSVAMAVSSHLLRIQAHENGTGFHIRKDNVLLAGPTGCGKTETFRVLRRLEDEMGIPVIMANAMEYSPNDAWKGTAVEEVLRALFEEAVGMYVRKHGQPPANPNEHEDLLRMASNGIILLDEFDKLSIRNDKIGNFCRDYQASLLKMVEGSDYQVGEVKIFASGDGNQQECGGVPVHIDTSNVMFVFLGAFDGLEDITRSRLKRERESSRPAKNRIGFMAGVEACGQAKETPEEADAAPSLEDLVEFGIMRELVGRIPIRTVYKPLSVDDMVRILCEAKTSPYLEYQERFQAMGHRLTCDDAALRVIAGIAADKKTGARGLSNVFFELLSPTMYTLSGTGDPMQCTLRGDDITARRPPVLRRVRRRARKKPDAPGIPLLGNSLF